MKITDFYTREKSNAGVTVPLPLPDGTASEATITVLGVDGDVFQKAKLERSRQNLKILQLPEAERPQALEDADTEMLVKLVTGWSFDEVCTPEAVYTLLKEAPHIREFVNHTAGDRQSFFKVR